MAKIPEIPFGYGDLVTVTGGGTKVVFWFKDFSGVIRGVIVDFTNPTAPILGKDEVLIKRRTEGQTRKKKLPPVGTPLDSVKP